MSASALPAEAALVPAREAGDAATRGSSSVAQGRAKTLSSPPGVGKHCAPAGHR
jgi:hypothetical protein